MKTKLTKAQRTALVDLNGHRTEVDDFFALYLWGSRRRAILTGLRRQGLVRYYSTRETWTITRAGRTAIGEAS